MPPTVHLVRHGQGGHNIEPTSTNRQIRDPGLTELGVARCKGFNKTFPEDVHIDLVCASPMRRTIQTAEYCFEHALVQTPSRRILLLPLAQEVTGQPCDVGSSPNAIETEFGGLVDLRLLRTDWTSKEGIYAATPEALHVRAGELRRWLQHRPEKSVVLVGHGAFWDFFLGSSASDVLMPEYKSSWTNRQWRTYTFSSDDPDAILVEGKESVMRRNLSNS